MGDNSHYLSQSNTGQDGPGPNGSQPSQPIRSPWTASSIDSMPVPPWQNGNGNGQQAQAPTVENKSVFAVPSGPGPTPQDIPGFPAPPTDYTPQTSSASAQSPSANAIRPLAGMTRPAAPQQAPPAYQTGQLTPAQAGQQGIQPLRPQMPAQGSPTSTGRLSMSMLGVSTDQLGTGYLDPLDTMFPEPRTMPETGINAGLISDLVLKTMYFTSYMSGQEISSALRLPFYGVLDQIINNMKKEQLCEVSGTAGLGEAGYQYLLTLKGMERAHQVLARSSYVGPAPVPLAKYIEAIRAQSNAKLTVTRDMVENALRGMVLGEELLNQVGAAVNAGKSLFLFGAPGNGKTLLAERIATMLGGSMAVPYAIEADGQVIQLFDLNSHKPVVPQGTNPTDSAKAELNDRRWVRVHRPVVVVGGELTMPSLDLVYNENAGFYEAPFQLKANGGLFLIDDFGRQQVSPQALLNRWIVPLEKAIDYLTLKTGKKLQVPFELFLVLSTNLQPEDLIDDAFLRRIQNKLFVPDPSPQHFYDIFLAQCATMNVPFNPQGFTHLVNRHYVEINRPFRASHPRDLLRQLIGIARYLNVQPEMTPQLLDAACGTYFVNSKKK